MEAAVECGVLERVPRLVCVEDVVEKGDLVLYL